MEKKVLYFVLASSITGHVVQLADRADASPLPVNAQPEEEPILTSEDSSVIDDMVESYACPDIDTQPDVASCGGSGFIDICFRRKPGDTLYRMRAEGVFPGTRTIVEP